MTESRLLSLQEVDVKAGSGNSMTMGALCRGMMTKLDWCGTLFPRIPVPIQKKVEQNLRARAETKLAEAELTRAVQQHLHSAQALPQ